MAPTRPLKRQRTNDKVPIANSPPKPEQIPLPAESPTSQSYPKPPDNATGTPRMPWYSSWSRKSAATAELAKQSASNDEQAETASIMSDRTITPRRSSTRSASLAMTLGKTGSTRSLPVDATTSKIHATSDARSPTRKNSKQIESPTKDTTSHQEPQIGPAAAEQAKSTDAKEIPTDPGKPHGTVRRSRQSGWFGWLAKEEEETGGQTSSTEAEPGTTKDSSKANDDEDSQGLQSGGQNDATNRIEADKCTPNQSQSPPSGSQKRSWLQMLGSDGPQKATSAPTGSSTDESKASPSQPEGTKAQKDETAPTKQADVPTSPPPPLPGDANKSAGWVFWSRDKDTRSKQTSSDPKAHQGEIAISDTPSEHQPKRTSISLPDENRPDPKTIAAMASPKTAKADAKSTKAESIRSVERPQTPMQAKDTTKPTPKVTKKTESKNASAVAVEQDGTPRPASPAPSRRGAENQLLPAFHDTLHLHQSPSLLQQLSRLLYYTKEPEPKHLSLVKDPPRLKNALAIGVHGFFPGPMVRTLIGQPTGTSIKFADMAAKSIRKWTNAHGYDCEVKTAALEGEGKIGERVDLLWKLLLNWIDEIRKSDFVMVACHSQGVPVAVMLVAKLIQFGCVNAARVGICAMAGVSMGPFVELKSRWYSGSAGELFEFSDPESKVSKDYQAASECILKAGVRLTFVGSIDDQLVSLESSIYAPVTHPHIYRAVLIDSKVHAPGFLSHLVGFVLKLRNLGVQDHGLIRELSSPLAGSLYTGEGHSRIYEDDAVYDMAVSFALETTAQLGIDATRRNIQASSGNPYILPFAMRGILEEDFVRSELRAEVDQLLQQFDDWKPTTKALKDVKFRLEGVRSKL
jgi:hypothetical protein